MAFTPRRRSASGRSTARRKTAVKLGATQMRKPRKVSSGRVAAFKRRGRGY